MDPRKETAFCMSYKRKWIYRQLFNQVSRHQSIILPIAQPHDSAKERSHSTQWVDLDLKSCTIEITRSAKEWSHTTQWVGLPMQSKVSQHQNSCKLAAHHSMSRFTFANHTLLRSNVLQKNDRTPLNGSVFQCNPRSLSTKTHAN